MSFLVTTVQLDAYDCVQEPIRPINFSNFSRSTEYSRLYLCALIIELVETQTHKDTHERDHRVSDEAST